MRKAKHTGRVRQIYIRRSHACVIFLTQLDQFAKGKLQSESGRSFQVITEGQLHLRQVLHPEACNKNITLPDYFHTFYDLRKEFRKFYRNNDVHTVDDMVNCK